MRFIIVVLLSILLIVSCSQKTNNIEDENSKSTDETYVENNIVQDMPLEEAIQKYEGNPCIDIIKDLLSVSVNNTLSSTTNIINSEDTEYDLSVTFDEGTTALMIASYYGYADLVNALIQNKADVNLKNKRNYTALLYATDIWARQGIGIYDSNFNVVELLVMNHADVNAVNNNGWSPLFFAADNSNSDVVTFLVDNGANINLVSDEGITPLLIANDIESVKAEIDSAIWLTSSNLKEAYQSGELLKWYEKQQKIFLYSELAKNDVPVTNYIELEMLKDALNNL